MPVEGCRKSSETVDSGPLANSRVPPRERDTVTVPSHQARGREGAFLIVPRRSLQERIMSTNCKACGRRGHWKAECPFKNAAAAGAGTSSSMPTTTAIVDESILHADDRMPMEFMMLPEEQTTSLDEDQPRGADQIVFLGLAETFVLGNHSQGFRHKPKKGDSMNQHE